MSNQASRHVKPLTAADVVRAEPNAADAAPALKVVPLKIAPLLAPYRKHGRLSLRIERMPQLARLSAGRNNGNGSWSLGGDELDELSYMVPESAGEHSLAIRVISVDRAAGNTLALLDYLVAFDGAGPGSAGSDAPMPRVVVADPDGPALQRLRDELSAAKATLAARESELGETRRRVELAEVELTKRKADAEIAVAQADWKADLDERLGAAVAQASLDLQHHRKAWEAEQAERTAKLEERALERLLEARERWQKEQEERLAAVETAWREKLAKAQSEARAAARGQVSEAELRAKDETLATLTSKLTESDAALLGAQSKFEEERGRWRQQAETALRKAEQVWRTKEAERLAAAETSWREKLASAGEDAAEARNEAALRHLREEFGALKRTVAEHKAELRAKDETLATVTSKLAESEAALLGAQSKFEEERGRWRQQAEAALRKAEQVWRTKETDRLAAAETSWREKLASAGEDAAEARNEAELRRLREEFGALERKLAERDSDLIQAQKDIEAAQQKAAHAPKDHDEIRVLQTVLAERDAELAQARLAAREAPIPRPDTTEEALAEAKTRWKADEAVRIAAVEQQWREYSESALAEAAHRYEAAEQALAQLRLEAETTHDNRVAHASSGHVSAQEPPVPSGKIVLRPNSAWRREEQAEAPRPALGRGLVRDALIAMALGASAIFFYPSIEPYLPPTLRLSSFVPPSGPATETPTPAAEPSPPPADAATPAPPPPRRATTLKDANVRAAPSTSATVVSRIPRGTAVPLGERRGDWILVRIENKDGWVHSSLLQEDGAATPQ